MCVFSAAGAHPCDGVTRLRVEIAETANTLGKLPPAVRVGGVSGGTLTTVRPHMALDACEALLHVRHIPNGLLEIWVEDRGISIGHVGLVDTEGLSYVCTPALCRGDQT